MNSQFGVFKSSFFYTEILSETGEKIAKNGPPNRLEFNSLPEPTKATVCQNRLAEPTPTDSNRPAGPASLCSTNSLVSVSR